MGDTTESKFASNDKNVRKETKKITKRKKL